MQVALVIITVYYECVYLMMAAAQYTSIGIDTVKRIVA